MTKAEKEREIKKCYKMMGRLADIYSITKASNAFIFRQMKGWRDKAIAISKK